MDGSIYITMDDIKQFWKERTGGEVTIAQIEETLTDIDKDGYGNIWSNKLLYCSCVVNI